MINGREKVFGQFWFICPAASEQSFRTAYEQYNISDRGIMKESLGSVSWNIDKEKCFSATSRLTRAECQNLADNVDGLEFSDVWPPEGGWIAEVIEEEVASV